MIDIESDIFDMVAKELRRQFPKIFISGEYVRTPPSLPAVFVMEESNTTYRATRDSSHDEVHAEVMYQVEVFTNDAVGKKSSAKAIFAVVDDCFIRCGFTRKMMNVLPNMSDATIYRMVGRYEAIVGKDKTIYRR